MDKDLEHYSMLHFTGITYKCVHLEYACMVAISFLIARGFHLCLWTAEKEWMKRAYWCQQGNKSEEGTSELMQAYYQSNAMKRCCVTDRTLAWESEDLILLAITSQLCEVGQDTSSLCGSVSFCQTFAIISI